MSWARICAIPLDVYTSYLVLGVIMFSAKLGEDAEQIGLGFISRWMPGGGHPKGHLICNSSLGATSLLHCILPYFFWNVPLAATFILQHSVLRKALQRSFGSWGRRIYSFTSAVALHLFMRNYQDSLKMLLLLHPCFTPRRILLAFLRCSCCGSLRLLTQATTPQNPQMEVQCLEPYTLSTPGPIP